MSNQFNKSISKLYAIIIISYFQTFYSLGSSRLTNALVVPPPYTSLLLPLYPPSKLPLFKTGFNLLASTMSESQQSTSSLSSSLSSSVIEMAKSWIQNDPNERTSSYIHNLIQKVTSEGVTNEEDEETLKALFPTDGSRIGFGTAGLRSAMQPGPLGMNDLVIIQATQGLAKYCQQVEEERYDKEGGERKELIAVIGYDHRSSKPEFNLSSKSFAFLTKLVFLEAGFECILLDGFVPTPLVAYSTTKLGAAVGVMITASHNPKNDAGM